MFQEYGSDSETEELPNNTVAHPRYVVLSNPTVLASKPTENIDTVAIRPQYASSQGQMLVTHNPRADAFLSLPEGPKHPYRSSIQSAGGMQQAGMKCGMGYVEEAAVDDSTFDEQYKSYLRSGYALSLGTGEVLGDASEHALEFKRKIEESNEGEQLKLSTCNNRLLIYSMPIVRARKRTKEEKGASHWSKRLPKDFVADADSVDPWAAEAEPSVSAAALSSQISELQQTPSGKTDATVTEAEGAGKANEKEVEDEEDPTMHIAEPELEDEKWAKVNERKMNSIMPARPARGSKAGAATTTFHGREERDYLGRSWMAPPPGLRAGDGSQEAFIPKKCIKKYAGHTKGVQEVAFFPKTGHLLLSASMDGKCKIWDVAGDRNVRRTYSGHSEAVRFVESSSLSCSSSSSYNSRHRRRRHDCNNYG